MIRLLLFFPTCLLLRHRPIPMKDCEGEQFGEACGRCGVRVKLDDEDDTRFEKMILVAVILLGIACLFLPS